MRRLLVSKKWNVLWVVSSLVVGCASPTPVKEVTREEIIRRHQILGDELARLFESRLKLKQDPEVYGYLMDMATRLVNGSPELQGSPVRLAFVRNEQGPWRNYSLPGNRIYLSTGLLRKLEYENEVAAALAVQFAQLMTHNVVNRLQEITDTSDDQSSAVDGLMLPRLHKIEPSVDYFGGKGIFSFSEEADIVAVRTAVGILYRCEYDVRGLVSLFKLYQENPGSSPYDPNRVSILTESIRREIAMFTPIRNPIVRSQAFIQIQKRMQRL